MNMTASMGPSRITLFRTVAVLVVFLACGIGNSPSEAAIRFGTGSAVSHRVEALDRKVEEHLRLQAASGAGAAPVRMADNAQIMGFSSMALLVSVSDDSSVLEFSDMDTQLASLEVGDVLVIPPSAENSEPLLRKITGIQIAGAGLRVTTEQAAITEVIKECSIDVTYELTEADFEANAAPHEDSPASVPSGARRARAPRLAALSLDDIPLPSITVIYEGGRLKVKTEYNDFVLYDHDGDPLTLEDQIKASGSVTFYPSSFRQIFEIRPDVTRNSETGKITRMEMTYHVEGEFGMKVVYDISDEASVTNHFPFFWLKYPQIPLLTVPPTPVSPPVVVMWIRPELAFAVGASGKLTAGLTIQKNYKMDGDLRIRLTPQYADNDSGITMPEFEVVEYPEYTSDSDWLQAEVSGEVEAYAGIQAAGYLNSVAGLKIIGALYARLEADLLRDPYPWWRASIGFTVLGGPAFVNKTIEENADYVTEKLFGFSLGTTVCRFFDMPLWQLGPSDSGILAVNALQQRAPIYIDSVFGDTFIYIGDQSVGRHVVSFGPVPGMKAPRDRVVTVHPDTTTFVYARYVPDVSLVSVRTNVDNAPIYLDGNRVGYGEYAGQLASGQHHVLYGPIAGMTTPDSRDFFVDCSDTVVLIGLYASVANPASVDTSILPGMIVEVTVESVDNARGSDFPVHTKDRYYIMHMPGLAAEMERIAAEQDSAWHNGPYPPDSDVHLVARDIYNQIRFLWHNADSTAYGLGNSVPLWKLDDVSFPTSMHGDYMALRVEMELAGIQYDEDGMEKYVYMWNDEVTNTLYGMEFEWYLGTGNPVNPYTPIGWPGRFPERPAEF